jgi:hypothetical protein
LPVKQLFYFESRRMSAVALRVKGLGRCMWCGVCLRLTRTTSVMLSNGTNQISIDCPTITAVEKVKLVLPSFAPRAGQDRAPTLDAHSSKGRCTDLVALLARV